MCLCVPTSSSVSPYQTQHTYTHTDTTPKMKITQQKKHTHMHKNRTDFFFPTFQTKKKLQKIKGCGARVIILKRLLQITTPTLLVCLFVFCKRETPLFANQTHYYQNKIIQTMISFCKIESTIICSSKLPNSNCD